MKPRCVINPISYGWLLDKYFILSKSNFKQNKMLIKEPGHGIWEFIQWPSANQNTTIFLEVEQGCIHITSEPVVLTKKNDKQIADQPVRFLIEGS